MEDVLAIREGKLKTYPIERGSKGLLFRKKISCLWKLGAT